MVEVQTDTAEAITLLRQSGFTLENGGCPVSQAVPRVGVVITQTLLQLRQQLRVLTMKVSYCSLLELEAM